MDKYLIKKKGEPSDKRPKVPTGASGDTVREGEPSDDQLNDGQEEEDLDHSKAQQKKTQKESSFLLKEVKGDLFDAPEKDSLAHCISADVRMGKGIATIFKAKFGGVSDLVAQGVKPGGVAVLKRGSRYIYYMVTKEKFWNKPTYDSLRRSLEAMRDHCVRHSVRALSMPRIGCGLDGLRWDQVRRMLSETFRETDVIVTVYTL